MTLGLHLDPSVFFAAKTDENMERRITAIGLLCLRTLSSEALNERLYAIYCYTNSGILWCGN